MISVYISRVCRLMMSILTTYAGEVTCVAWIGLFAIPRRKPKSCLHMVKQISFKAMLLATAPIVRLTRRSLRASAVSSRAIMSQRISVGRASSCPILNSRLCLVPVKKRFQCVQTHPATVVFELGGYRYACRKWCPRGKGLCGMQVLLQVTVAQPWNDVETRPLF